MILKAFRRDCIRLSADTSKPGGTIEGYHLSPTDTKGEILDIQGIKALIELPSLALNEMGT